MLIDFAWHENKDYKERNRQNALLPTRDHLLPTQYQVG